MFREGLAKFQFVRLKELNPVCLSSVDSTQDYLIKELSSKHEGDFVVSDIQTSGRGREGRSWYSDIGGLYFSITLAPNKIEVLDQIAPMVTRVIRDALENDFHLTQCSLKPLNDVICRGKKIAGVLVDAELNGISSRAYIGIGVDLNNGKNWTEEMKKIATSYFLETRTEICVDDFILSLLSRLDHEYFELMSG